MHLANPFDLGHKGWKYTTVLLATYQELLSPLGNVARDVDEGESVSIITAGSSYFPDKWMFDWKMGQALRLFLNWRYVRR